jgi:hypothetical protein
LVRLKVCSAPSCDPSFAAISHGSKTLLINILINDKWQTLPLLELKWISFCLQYRASLACMSVPSDQALYCWWPTWNFYLEDLPQKMIMDSSNMVVGPVWLKFRSTYMYFFYVDLMTTVYMYFAFFIIWIFPP